MHVLNLVVQLFIIKYPAFQEVLHQARMVCRWSYLLMAQLVEKQHQHQLQANYISCKPPT